MEVGLVGLGRMGANMARRWLRHGHTVIGYARTAATVNGLVADGAISGGATSLPDLVARLAQPRVLWLMVPAASVDATLAQLVPLLGRGDIVIDGGNSWFRDDIRRARELEPAGIAYLDCGTSGGTWGLERGYCLMIGGPSDAVAHLDPIFQALAPGVETASRTPGRAGDPDTAEQGYLHCGPAGGGHFVKMVHNGIEYGIMAAYAEGLNLLHHAGAGLADREVNAETSPLRDPELYQYRFDLAAVTELWRRGQRHRVVAPGPHRAGPAREPRPRRLRGRRRRLRRGSLDEPGRHRDLDPHAGPHDRALLALHLARRGGLRQQGPVRDAPRASAGTSKSRQARHRRRAMSGLAIPARRYLRPPVPGRPGHPSRHRLGALPQGARVRHPCQRRRVQRGRQPRRLLRPADGDRVRDGRLPRRRAGPRARPGSRGHSLLSPLRPRRGDGPEHRDRLLRPGNGRPCARRLLQPGQRGGSAASAGRLRLAGHLRPGRPLVPLWRPVRGPVRHDARPPAGGDAAPRGRTAPSSPTTSTTAPSSGAPAAVASARRP